MVRLTIIKPEQTPDVLSFEEAAELTVGRSAGCNYCLDFDPMVSRMHAVILIDPPSVRIKDLNSTNGLSINGESYGAYGNQKIIHPIELRDGDEVVIGSTKIRVNVIYESSDGQPPSAAPAAENQKINSSYTTAEGAAGGDLEQAGAEDTVSSTVPSLPSIPGYRLTRFLSKAQTGNVYLGVSNADGKTVAIKVICPGLSFTRKMLDDFRREVAGAAVIQHTNIARMLGSGELGNRGVFLVMEYVNGEDLASYLKRCPNNRIPLHNAYNLMLQLSSAMCYIHSHDFVHMDIKPSSIILYDDNGRLRAKISDMGYAHFMDDTGIAPRGVASRDAARLGYLAPEELSPMGDAKTTADVFSLSAVFYEILTGRVPYNFGGGDNAAVVAAADLTPIEEVMSGLPEPLVVIIERGLSADPEARYQNGCDLLEALENVWV